MQTKDYIYVGLIALSAAVFYWHGYLAARARARRTFAALFRLSRTMVEMPPPTDDDAIEIPANIRLHGQSKPRSSAVKIRAVFGVN